MTIKRYSVEDIRRLQTSLAAIAEGLDEAVKSLDALNCDAVDIDGERAVAIGEKALAKFLVDVLLMAKRKEAERQYGIAEDTRLHVSEADRKKKPRHPRGSK